MRVGTQPNRLRPPASPTAVFPRRNGLYVPFLILLFILVWSFAWYMERPDLQLQVNRWWQIIFVDSNAPSGLVLLWELVQPRVLRHLLPVFVGWWLARGGAISLVRMLYNLPNQAEAANYLSMLQAGRATNKPLLVQGATLAEERPKFALLRVGGPGRIQIINEEVGLTELNGRFYRVLGPGVHTLLPFEYLYTVLDLRPQERTATKISLITRDGIEITTDVSLTFRINTGHEPVTRAKPYPFDYQAVRTVAYTQTALADRVLQWDEIPANIARSKMAQIVARHNLDELLHPGDTAYEPYLTIRNELERLVRAACLEKGIELMNIHIGRPELPTAVTQQYIKFWETHLQGQIRLNRIEGDVTSLHSLQMARTEAELAMVEGILEGLQRAQQEGSIHTVREVVALRLIEALERMARQSQQTHPLPNQLLPQLATLRQQLLPEKSAESHP